MKRLIASSLALLLLAAAPLWADDPATTIMGGIRGTAIEVNHTHLVEWSNNTLHKLKFSFTLTLDDGTSVTHTGTLASKQKIQDAATLQKLHNITRIQISHIEIMD